MGWLRGVDLNHRPLGYEPNELPDCSTPRIDDNNRAMERQTRELASPRFLAKILSLASARNMLYTDAVMHPPVRMSGCGKAISRWRLRASGPHFQVLSFHFRIPIRGLIVLVPKGFKGLGQFQLSFRIKLAERNFGRSKILAEK